MKKVFYLTAILFSFYINAQDREFKITNDGMTDYVVTIVESKNQEEIYKKTLDWVTVTYNTPVKVIKAQLPSEYIRIEGSIPEFQCIYQIEISFKPEKYKFDLISVNRQLGDINMPLELDKKDMLNSKGEVKWIYNLYGKLTPIFNDLNNKLKEFILSDKIPSKKDEW